MSILWRIYCTEPGDEGFQYAFSDTAITECPNNSLHSVNANSVSEFKRKKAKYQIPIHTESNSNSWMKVGEFVYDGTESTADEILNFAAIAYTRNTSTYHRWRVYDVQNQNLIATSAASNGGILGEPVYVDLGNISNLPSSINGNYIFEIQLLATDMTGNTGVSDRNNVGITTFNIYNYA